MPLQKPSSRSISMSNWVRWRSRCDSSSLPCASSSLVRASSSSRISPTARSIVWPVGGVVGGRPDADVLEVAVDLAGQRVEVLDGLDLVAEEDRAEGGLGVGREDLERLARARGTTPRPSTESLREYWLSTSLRSTSSRSTMSPFLSVTTWALYFCGEPMP